MKTVTKIFTTALAASALALGTIAGPAAADTQISGIDLSQVPDQINYTSGCNDYAFIVNLQGGDSTSYYSMSASMTGSDSGISVSNDTQSDLRAKPGVPQSLSAFVCDTLVNAGPQTLTVTVKLYGYPDVVATKAVSLRSITPNVQITSVSGKLAASAKKTAQGTAGKAAVGQKISVFYQKAGTKKFKKVASTKVKATTYGSGTWKVKTTKLGVGKMYVKLAEGAYVKGQKTKAIKLVRRAF